MKKKSNKTKAVEQEVLTSAQFNKRFKEEIKETTDWLLREDKEGDFKSKAHAKEAAIWMVKEIHDEVTVSD